MSNNSESLATAAAKLSPPVTVSLANIGGYQVSEIVMIVTLIYTTALLIHKLWQMFTDVCDRIDRKKRQNLDRRAGQPDFRDEKIERRVSERRNF